MPIIFRFVIYSFLVFSFNSCVKSRNAKKLPPPLPDTQNRITISGNDVMMYDKKSFSAIAGSEFTLILRHKGTLSKNSMGHNIVIIDKKEDVFKFGAKVNANGGLGKNGFIPVKVKEKIIAHTAMIGGGEESVIIFTVPEETGSYPFLCTFPGHFSLMNGFMTVLSK